MKVRLRRSQSLRNLMVPWESIWRCWLVWKSVGLGHAIVGRRYLLSSNISKWLPHCKLSNALQGFGWKRLGDRPGYCVPSRALQLRVHACQGSLQSTHCGGRRFQLDKVLAINGTASSVRPASDAHATTGSHGFWGAVGYAF